MVLEFEKLINARELGGLRAAGGRVTRPGLLFRTAGLFPASEGDLARLAGEYGIRHVFDFRDLTEVERQPDPELPGAERHLIPVLPALPGGEELRLEGKSPQDVLEVFRRMYLIFAQDDVCADAYRRFFRILVENAGQPVLWHCTQGKDRTGVAALLLLTALGVSERDILDDYYLSNTGLQCEYQALIESGMDSERLALMRMVLFVQSECIGDYLQSLERGFGGTEGYLRTRLGLTDADFAALREGYTR